MPLFGKFNLVVALDRVSAMFPIVVETVIGAHAPNPLRRKGGIASSSPGAYGDRTAIVVISGVGYEACHVFQKADGII